MKITYKDYLKIYKFFESELYKFREERLKIFNIEYEKCFKPYFDMKKETGYEDKICMFDIRHDNSIKEKILAAIDMVKKNIKESDFYTEYFNIEYEECEGFIDIELVKRQLKFSNNITKEFEEMNLFMEL